MKTKLMLTAAVAAMLFGACSGEDNSKTSDSNYQLKSDENGNANMIAAFQENRNNMKQHFAFNAEGESVTLVSESGVEINVNPANLRVHGRPVRGRVNVEFIEVFGRGNMAATGLLTMGVPEGEANPDAEVAPLRSGGEFYVNMTTEEGQDIDDGAPYTLSVPAELTGGEGENSEGMIVWTGEEDENGDVKWVKDTDEGGEDVDVPVEDGKYIMELLSFGWCNIDKLDQIPGKKTGIWVEVPSGYNETNSRVLVAYQGNQNMLCDIKDFDYSLMQFHDTHDNFAIGENYHIIFITKVNGPWEIGIQQITVAGNDLVTFTPGDINTVSDPALINMLSSLP